MVYTHIEIYPLTCFQLLRTRTFSHSLCSKGKSSEIKHSRFCMSYGKGNSQAPLVLEAISFLDPFCLKVGSRAGKRSLDM